MRSDTAYYSLIITHTTTIYDDFAAYYYCLLLFLPIFINSEPSNLEVSTLRSHFIPGLGEVRWAGGCDELWPGCVDGSQLVAMILALQRGTPGDVFHQPGDLTNW